MSQLSGMSALPGGGVSGLVPDGATGFTPNPKRPIDHTRSKTEEGRHHQQDEGETAGNVNLNRNENVAIGDRIKNWREADKERREARNNRGGGNRFAWESSESVYWGS